MKYISTLFSLLFILASLLSIYWGTLIIQLNMKSRINQVFLLLSIAVSIWAFGFGMANTANNLEMAIFWRRYASLGMISLYSFVLHFFLLLTRQNHKKQLSKWVYLLYVPAIILIFVFTISSSMATIQYDLVQTDFGLTNIAPNSIWNYFYYIYFAIYMFSGLGIVWKWKKEIKEPIWTRQANIIIQSTLASGILATLTDIVTTTFLEKPLPQMAPLFILPPVWAMYYSARHYGMMDLGQTYDEEMVVTEDDKRKIFNNLSIAIYIGAILSFFVEYIPQMSQENALGNAFLSALSISSIGLAINLVQNLKNKELKEKLTILSLVGSVPVVILQYIKYGGITVWVFPVIIMISSIVFSRLILLISTTVAAIITQILIWAINPEVIVTVNMYDYLFRIGMFIVLFLIGLYINRIYVDKIKENQAQIAFQEMVSAILFDFVDINEKNIDDHINHFLERIGLFFNVDRTYLFTIDQQAETMTYSNEWCSPGIGNEVGTIAEMPLTTFPWWMNQLKRKRLVYIADTDLMPKEALAEQKQLHRQGVKSLVSVPVVGKDGMLAFIGIDSVKAHREWSKEKIEMLNIMARILYGGMMQVESDKEIEFMAFYDDLTKLPNRILFTNRVKQAIYRSERKKSYLAVIFIDLDNFKTVNDTVGHEGGDELLRHVAKRLSSKVRKSDTVARFGGDEFMMLINDLEDKATIKTIVQHIMTSFDDLFTLGGQEFLVTASAGIARYPEDGIDTETLINNADLAMYKAKDKGKNQYVLCTNGIKDEAVNNTTLLKDLGYAMAKDELELYYQPQINTTTNGIIGFEALLRWKHPTKGMISPAVFIPIAEENNLINDIGQWVLKTAATQNKKWQDMGLPPMPMAVNLSAVEMMQPNIVEIVENTIKETGLDPKYIELEITEGIAIEETAYVVDLLNQLKKIGVSLTIDDFGAEYSSLNRLKLLPVDRLKIDIEFIQGIEDSPKARAITKGIIDMGKNLGVNVVAEGVETAQQLAFLDKNNCQFTQGFYHYKPMPAEAIENLFNNL